MNTSHVISRRAAQIRRICLRFGFSTACEHKKTVAISAGKSPYVWIKIAKAAMPEKMAINGRIGKVPILIS